LNQSLTGISSVSPPKRREIASQENNNIFFILS
jgi:hypothetical protein